MNEWYELLYDLETDPLPLDEIAQTRIEKRVLRALPCRRKRPPLIAVIAAVLILTACGYAAVSGQFSDWFWNVTDQEDPPAAEDLLASMGTVIDQSQTVNGTTMTLHGAIWDGENLMLSLTVENESIPTDHWRTNVETVDSWLCFSKAELKETWEDAYPNTDQTELETKIDAYLDAARDWSKPKINYLQNRYTQDYYLQVEQTIASSQNSIELELHLENLEFRGASVPGPFEFTFTVEQKFPEVIYEGTAVLKQENGVELHLSRVYLTPFRAEVDFEISGTMTEEEFHERWYETNISGLVIGDETETYISTGNSITCKREDNGTVSGTISCGPFHEALDPTSVSAVELEHFILDLDTFIPTPRPED